MENKKNKTEDIKVKLIDIDYKNIKLLQRFIGNRNQIIPKKYTKLSSKLQRKLSSEIKKARQMALLKYTDRH